MKLAVIVGKYNWGDNVTIDWQLEKIFEGTEKDIARYGNPEEDRLVIPFEQVGEDPTTGYAWDKFDNTVAYIENGKFVRWLNYREGEYVFESLWGNIFR